MSEPQKILYDTTLKIHVWIGTFANLSKVVRTLPKSIYNHLDSNSVHYYPSSTPGTLPHATYNLFHESSDQFHLVSQGDLDETFNQSLLAYCTEEVIALPRAQGGGEAPVIKKRIPVVVLCETMDWVEPYLLPHVKEYYVPNGDLCPCRRRMLAPSDCKISST